MKAHESLNVLQARAPKKLLHRYLMALWGLNIYTKVPGLLGCFRKGVRVEASSRSCLSGHECLRSMYVNLWAATVLIPEPLTRTPSFCALHPAARSESNTLGSDIGIILGLYWNNGQENGNYCLGFRVQGHGMLCRGVVLCKGTIWRFQKFGGGGQCRHPYATFLSVGSPNKWAWGLGSGIML